MSAALRTLVNGMEASAGTAVLGSEERGLQYGDGLFETMLLRDGRVRFQADHLARLHAGCARLNIGAPARLEDDLQRLQAGHRDGLIKLIVTRGSGGRGYRAPVGLTPTQILSLYAALPADSEPIAVCWCATRLARNPLLAGMKHLNRLEQVLAQSEFSAVEFADGLMLDTEGELVCATSGNIFAVIDGVLVTPDLRFAGVQGVMRKQVIAAATRLGIAVEERPLWPAELAVAEEIFLTNAIRGVRRVRRLDGYDWQDWPVAQRLATELELS